MADQHLMFVPDEVILEGSIRTMSQSVANKYITEMNKITCENCILDTKIEKISPYTYNSNKPINRLKKAINNISGTEAINIEENYRTLLSEDFSYYTELVDACYFLVGAKFENNETPLHASNFMCDERAMNIAFQIFTDIIRKPSI